MFQNPFWEAPATSVLVCCVVNPHNLLGTGTTPLFGGSTQTSCLRLGNPTVCSRHHTHPLPELSPKRGGGGGACLCPATSPLELLRRRPDSWASNLTFDNSL